MNIQISIKRFIIIDIITCIFVVSFLFWLIYYHQMSFSSIDLSYVPTFNAINNSLCFVFLIMALIAIKKNKVTMHRAFIHAALVCSTIFLIGYVIYHYFHGDTHFLYQGWIRYLYFSILISHIFLSVVMLPCILLTYWLALFKTFKLHRRVARITLPIWMYVSFTGVLVYLLLHHY